MALRKRACLTPGRPGLDSHPNAVLPTFLFSSFTSFRVAALRELTPVLTLFDLFLSGDLYLIWCCVRKVDMRQVMMCTSDIVSRTYSASEKYFPPFVLLSDVVVYVYE